MSYKKNIASNFITRIIKIILGFGISIIIARALGPEGKGYIQYLILIFGLIASYGHFGINNATSFFYKKSKYDINDIYCTNLSYLILMWIIISIILIFLKYTNIILIKYSWFLFFEGLIFIIFNFIQISIRGIYIGDERIIEINKYFMINNLFVFISLIIFYYFDILSASLYFTVKVSGIVINAILFLKNNKHKYKFKINKLLLKDEFKYGIIIYFSALFIYLNYRADQFLIKIMINNSSLGIYSIGVNLSELVFLIPQSITTALNGKLYNLSLNSNKRKTITILTIKYTLYVSILLVIVGMFMTPLVPFVYGKEFYDSILIIRILFFGVIFASIGKVSAGYFYTKGAPKVHLIITFLTLVFNIILNLILIPNYGINGAALSSTIAYFIYGVSYIFYFKYNEGFDIKRMLLLNKKDIGFFKSIIIDNYNNLIK